jgi:hypothetical protein
MKRTAAVAAVVGLATGLGLGITGIAGAVGGTPTPSPSQRPHVDRPHGPPAMPGWRGFTGGHRTHGKRSGGIVTAVGSDSITVALPRGVRTVTLNGATTYFRGKDKATKAAVKVGEVVGITLVDPGATTPVAKTVVVLPAHLEGLVTKVDGSTITIVDHDGFTRTIHAASAPAVKAGQFVAAVGTVDADGTTLDAISVQVLDGKGFAKPQKPKHG